VALSALAPPELALSVAPDAPDEAEPDVGPLPDIAPAPLVAEPEGDVGDEAAPLVACASTKEFSPCLLETELSCAAEIPAAESSETNSASDTFFIVASKLDMDCL
jgi:hypothetical protein